MAKLEIEMDLDRFMESLEGKEPISRSDMESYRTEFMSVCSSAIMFAVRLSTPGHGMDEFFAEMPMGTYVIRYAAGKAHPAPPIEKMMYAAMSRQLRVMKAKKEKLDARLRLPF